MFCDGFARSNNINVYEGERCEGCVGLDLYSVSTLHYITYKQMLRERFASTSLHFSPILSDVVSLPPITISLHLSRSRFVFVCFAISEHMHCVIYGDTILKLFTTYKMKKKKNGKNICGNS